MQSAYYEQLHEGMEVLDTNGEKIGMCGETVGDYFNVDAGFLGTNEYWVPFSAITNITDGAVFLNTTRDRIDSMGWKERPEVTTGATGVNESGHTMQLRQEELQARKTPVQTGSVHLGKDVVEEHRSIDVPVTREEVFVERHPVDRRPADQPISDSEGETIRVPITEERVEVEKQPVVYEEVGVGKRISQETQRVSDTVRREELRMDN